MKDCLKTISVSLFLLAILIANLSCGNGVDEGSSSRSNVNSEDDLAQALISAEKILDENAPQNPPESHKSSDGGYEIAEPKNIKNPYLTRVNIPDYSTPPKNETAEEVVYDNGDPTKLEDSVEEKPQSEKDGLNWEPQYSNRESKYGRSESEKSPDKSAEKSNYDSDVEQERFLSNVQDWCSKNTTATKSRIKATSIRNDADALRRRAENEPENSDDLLRQAEVMDDYANRISATHGVTRKMRALRNNIDNEFP